MAGAELHEKASDPLRGRGKVTEYFVGVSHPQSEDVHFLLGSLSCSGDRQAPGK